MTASLRECVACCAHERDLRAVIAAQQRRQDQGRPVDVGLIARAKARRDESVNRCQHPALRLSA